MKVVSTPNAPAAIGPYSQALDLGNMVFVSGQLPVDPATGTMADTVEQQAAQSLANLKAILAEAGLSMNNVVKTVIFLADINDFAAVNAEYAKAFAEVDSCLVDRSIGDQQQRRKRHQRQRGQKNILCPAHRPVDPILVGDFGKIQRQRPMDRIDAGNVIPDRHGVGGRFYHQICFLPIFR